MTETSVPDRSTYDRIFSIGRENWRFDLPASTVLGYARAALAYHEDRLAWWTTEAETAEGKIRDAGIKVEGHAITGGTRHEVIVDQTLVARLGECQSKQAVHREHAERLGRWTALLSTMDATAILALTSADADYFEIGRHDEPAPKPAKSKPASRKR